MKRLNWSVFFLILSLSLKGQPRADYGFMAGISSYMGDINPGRLMYSPKPAGGLFYRFNFNPRQALRANIMAGGLNGNDLDFSNSFQQSRARSFSGLFGELAIQYEFNFFPYSTDGKTLDYTPYLAAGAGVAYSMTVTNELLPVIPFSIGFKFNILKNMGLEAEYGFRKTFYDNFDGLKDFVDPADYSLIHNNDWYSFAGISLTWKLMSKLAGCPAYGDADSNR
ncbi:MAG TPA: DUF6089 family protein [Bacteroidales bacterium]|nr:DUF6089 family protein [Bacteroidales bacterium]